MIANTLTRELSQEFEGVVNNRLACLSWLLAHSLLEIKIAVIKDLRDDGIYHEKLGVFFDAEGNRVAFGGSANESARAYRRNFERIDVFRSWQVGDDERIDEKLADFEELWQNQTPELDVMEFPETAKRKLLERCPEYPPEVEQEIEADRKAAMPSGDYRTVLGVPMLPKNLVLRNYQQEAVANWFKNKGCGTLKMATGSGKTITALAIAVELYKKCAAQNKPLQALLIVCPYRHLVTQWAEESHRFGLQPILAFDRVQTWQGDLQAQLLSLMGERRPFITIITTNATLRQDSLQSQLSFLPPLTLIIGDEAHNLGAANLATCLPDRIKLRLALSATPERYFDEVGTERIFEYFGPVLEPDFTLKDAIQAGALVQYTYKPLLVELIPEEIERYAELTAAIGRAMGMGGCSNNVALERLLFERARLLSTAQNKLAMLRSLMANRLNTDHTLFYCGDGSVEDETTEASRRQLAAVTHLLKDELGYAVEPYVAETTLVEREELRYAFEQGQRRLHQRWSGSFGR